MTQVKVLYQRTPMWRVGEDRPPCTRAELAARLEEFAALGASERYPGDYSGRVISVVPADRAFTPADLADPRRAVALMDSEDAAALRSRRLKVVGKASADVTFSDRWGAVGKRMRSRCTDPEAWESDEAAAVEAAEATNATALERYELEAAAHRIAREEYAKALVGYDPALGAEPPVLPERPKPLTLVERENAFEREAGAIARALPPTVTHTGAGLYKVQAAGTMPTPAHLWAMEAVNPTDDGTPGGNPGTGSNVTVVGGQIGSALEFNGNDSNVNVGDVAELNSVQKFTMMFRMNQDVLDQNDMLFRKQGVSASYRVTLQPAADGEFYFVIANGASTFGRFDYSTLIDAGGWHHVTVVFDGSQTGDANRLKVYVDGIPVTLAFAGPIPATTADLSGVDATISWGSAPAAFDGKIDDFRIYADEAFSDAQVKDIAGRGLAHWDTIASFNENLLLESERFNVAWSQAGTLVVTPNTDLAPNGQKTADTLTEENVTQTATRHQTRTVPDDSNWVYGLVHVKKDSNVSRFPYFQVYLSGGSNRRVIGQLNTLTGAVISIYSIGTISVNVTDLGTYWRVEVGVQNDGTGNTAATIYIAPASSTVWGNIEVAATGSIVAWGAQVSLVSLKTYKPTRSATDTSVTLTTGGLTDGERDGEVFVSGGNAYAVVRAGADSVLVVGDATGEAGTCNVSPYTTFQSALVQLWADQGSTTFTETQYVRGFAGTYDETVEPNSGLVTSWGQYALIVEGDPTDDRDNIVIAPSSGIAFQVGGPDYITLRHMKVAPVGAESYGVYFKSGSQMCTAQDLHVVGEILNPIYLINMGRVEDCVIETSSSNAARKCVYFAQGGVAKNCTITGTGGLLGLGIWFTGYLARVEGCTITGFENGIRTNDGRLLNDLVCRNVTIYNCTKAMWLGASVRDVGLEMINCIISTVGTHIILYNTWPDESGGLYGPAALLRNNVFHSYNIFADDGAATKTYAEFIALSRCDASGDLDSTDPLLTNPAAGDFSLQAASPCRGTGHGSGVIAYVDGTPAHANHPNIGAEGLATDPPAPVWTAGLSGLAATDERVGDEIALAWGAASIGGSGLSVEYGVQRRIGAGAWTTVWIGSGTSTHVCECVTGQLYEFRVGARCADYEQDWVYPTDSAAVTATLPVPPTVADWSVSGTTVTVTLTGVAGRTYRARLMDGAGGEDDEQGRTGSGDVVLMAAGYGARYFAAWELIDGVQSEPTGVYAVTVDDPADAGIAYYRVKTVTGFPGAPHKVAMLERIERPIQP